jgi:hypothetical protein
MRSGQKLNTYPGVPPSPKERAMCDKWKVDMDCVAYWLPKIAAALNAASQERRDAERTEVHWTALKCSLEICEIDNVRLAKLVQAFLPHAESSLTKHRFAFRPDVLQSLVDEAKEVLAARQPDAALQTDGTPPPSQPSI